MLDNEKIVVIIDGNSVAYRAYYANQNLVAKGVQTGVVHIFLTVIERLQNLPDVESVITVFDAKGKNKRHEMLESYKEKRAVIPEELLSQINIIKEIIPTMGLPLLSISGYEADDVINTLAKDLKDNKIYIITKDKDLHQLIDDRVFVYDYQKDIIIDRDKVFEKYQVYPEGIRYLLSLSGDKSDNVPGVLGVGDVTALKLLNAYQNLDNIYANIDKIDGKLKDKLINGKDSAYLSYDLVELFYIDNLTIDEGKKDNERLLKLLTDYKLTSHIPKLIRADNIDTFLMQSFRKLRYGNVTEPKVLIYFNEQAYLADDKFISDVSSKVDIEKLKYVYDIKSLIKLGVADFSDKAIDLLLISYIKDSEEVLQPKKDEDGFEFFGRVMDFYDRVDATLNEEWLSKLYYSVELPVANILAKAELDGVLIDEDIINNIATRLRKDVNIIEKKFRDISKADINLNSPMQMADFFSNTLKLELSKKGKRGFSIDEEVLQDLFERYPEHQEIVGLFLTYRELNKLLSTYTLNLLDYRGSDDRIHTIFKQTGTSTGRLSSIKPNMQNLPRNSEYAKLIRSAFISAKGYKLLSIDYSQIELRILAELSQDENLIKAFRDDVDIHTDTARKIYDYKDNDEISELDRRSAKAVNFGIIYGLSAFGLSQDLKISRTSAKEFIDKYYALYPSVRAFLDNIIKSTERDGYVETLLGRRRYIRDINSRNAGVKSRAERMALNSPIQGSAADIIKLAMIKSDEYIMKNGIDARQILQIHDELIFEINEDIIERVKEDLVELMQSVIKLSVPLKVNAYIGLSLDEV